MTTEDAWQAALDANPDDSVCRLAFADWLDDQGDPRSAWYRDSATSGKRPYYRNVFIWGEYWLWVSVANPWSRENVFVFDEIRSFALQQPMIDLMWEDKSFENADYSSGWRRYRSRREADDAAALAYAAQEELWNSLPTSASLPDTTW